MINIHVEIDNQERVPLEIPVDMGLSLMEVLKAYEYDILATCGGMALCATCHIEVLQGAELLPDSNDAELDILDTMPDANEKSRLACQLRPSVEMNGLVIRLKSLGEN
tara:strand:- start:107 stop:430 length:324 start_codon:yes stop_codon:yes gene_type:complete